MPLKNQIHEDMKSAMRNREPARLGAIRLLMAAIKQREVDERIELDDTAVIGVIDKMIKQRRDSIAQYEAAQRTDLATAEKLEIDVLSAYMPQAASAEDIAAAISQALTDSAAQAPQDMGKVMGLLKARLAGRADMTLVLAQVKARLTGA